MTFILKYCFYFISIQILWVVGVSVYCMLMHLNPAFGTWLNYKFVTTLVLNFPLTLLSWQSLLCSTHMTSSLAAQVNSIISEFSFQDSDSIITMSLKLLTWPFLDRTSDVCILFQPLKCQFEIVLFIRQHGFCLPSFLR